MQVGAGRNSMTDGFWECVGCGKSKIVNLDEPPMKCPHCGAEYEQVEVIEGAHAGHSIPVMRLKGSDLLNVVQPAFAFAMGRDKEAFERYSTLAEKAHELAEKARGKRGAEEGPEKTGGGVPPGGK